MKQEKMTFSLCLAAVVMASAVSFSAIMCMVEAFSLPCRPEILVIVSCLVSGVAMTSMIFKRGWIIGLCVLLVYFIVLLWQGSALARSVQTFLYQVTTEYARCFQISILGRAGGSAQLLLAALIVPIAWLCVWVICREAHVIYVIFACVPIYVLCLLVVDIAPVFWLVLLTGALMLLLLSGSVRAGSANEGGRLIWWLMLPVMIVFFVLMSLSPVTEYSRSDWSQNLQSFAEDAFDLEFWEKQTAAYSGLWNAPKRDVDLRKVGPKQKTGAHALQYSAETPIRYLRGSSYGVYEDNTWKTFSTYSGSYDFDRTLATTEGAESVQLQVITPFAEDVLYTTYPLSAIPAGGTAQDDSCITNTEKLKSYYVSYGVNGAAPAGQNGTYDQFVMANYLQLPEQLRPQLERILQENGLTDADAIVAFVRQSGVYDLQTQRVPDTEDFVLYFLEQSHRGYCVHFATSAALLLRAAGIPSRYVTGYSVSGEAGQLHTVTQDDAHAWVEYYVEGKGWFPLEPTPSDGSQTAETDHEAQLPVENDQEQSQPPESVPQPQEPGTEVSPQTSAVQTGHTVWEWLRWLLVLPVAAVLLLLHRAVALYCRKRRYQTQKPNRRMLLLWERLVRLHKVTKSAIPEEMICLAEKAKFSQHIINDEELALMSDALQRQIACLRQLSVWRRLWHKYILVLY